MKSGLPPNHGLSAKSVGSLVFRDAADAPLLTDVQHAALERGVASAASMLVVSPTSTGKTQIAVWAIANAVEREINAVYLVTHRALARQKFDELRQVLLKGHLQNDRSAIVLATGDVVQDASGEPPADPLGARIIVATYEKYLGLLSASGIPSKMGSTLLCCDEVQLIGDETRGQNVEILLTLLRNAKWKQFVGLSAVLQHNDAEKLATWLGVELLVEHQREKELEYECWTSEEVHRATTAAPDADPVRLARPKAVKLDCLQVLQHLTSRGRASRPVIVFCMSKRETYDLASKYSELQGGGRTKQLSLAFSDIPATNANALLAKYMPQRIAIHNADLLDEEREVIERALVDRKIDVVFATSTLAAGVNFPFGVALFASWRRWDSDTRSRVPIDSAEFHNMAGRAGRMGSAHESGKVIFVAETDHEVRQAAQYMRLGDLPALDARITPDRFDQLALQLVASRVCTTRRGLAGLVISTFSAERERASNPRGFATWTERLDRAIDELVADKLLLQRKGGNLSATAWGQAAAFSGLLPSTGRFLLQFACERARALVDRLPTESKRGDPDALNFALLSASLSSPEFRQSGDSPPTRGLPYPLEKNALFDANRYRDLLVEPVWQADLSPINGAKLTLDWINGAELRALEGSLPNLSAGMLREMFRNLVWVMHGFANVLVAAADSLAPPGTRPAEMDEDAELCRTIRRLPRVIRRLARRVAEGLPDAALWLCELNYDGGTFRLTRTEAIELWRSNLASPQELMKGDPATSATRAAVFKTVKPAPEVKANWLRDAAREWKEQQRRSAAERHVKRTAKCPRADLVTDFYNCRGEEFEQVFEEILAFLKVKFEKLDNKTKTGAPDYLVYLGEEVPMVVELKSRGTNLIDYNRSVEVLAASEVHGHKDKPCVTLCHPGVDPSVPSVIVKCGRLTVVETPDMGEALVRLCEGVLSEKQLHEWLTTPGQALASDLPFKERDSDRPAPMPGMLAELITPPTR